MNKWLIAIKIVVGHFTTVKRNTVFFDSFLGQYNDNPKYVSELLHKRRPDIEIVWTVSERGRERPPAYVKCVSYHSREYFDYMNNAAVVVDNHMGLRSFGFIPGKKPFLSWIVKKRNQLCISTWHGTPLKKIGRDTICRSVDLFCSSTQYCIAGNKYAEKAIGNAFCVGGKMRMYGTPRNDIFFQKDVDIEKLKSKLKLPMNRGILLFAPTFRDSVNMSGIEQLKRLNITKLLGELETKFGRAFVFVFRVHHSVANKIDEEKLLEEYGDTVIDGNIGDDMAEYLLCSDILLTDYSSSFFDFALTKRPCFLYAPDLEKYENVERGMYMDFKALPFPKAVTAEDLLNQIHSFSEKEYQRGVEKFLIDIGNMEDGRASERIVNDILEYLDGLKNKR